MSAVRYTEEQLATLSAMGLIAWVRRDSSSVESVGSAEIAGSARSDGSAELAGSAELVASATSVEQGTSAEAPGTAPAGLEQLLDWLSLLPVRALDSAELLGAEAPSVLVVLEPPHALPSAAQPRPPDADVLVRSSAPDGRVPERGDAIWTLTENMLKAIGLGRGTFSLVVPEASTSLSVEALCRDKARLVLFLSHQQQACERDLTQRFASLDESLIAWRIPHPAAMLVQPALKQIAWQTLKSVRQHLGES